MKTIIDMKKVPFTIILIFTFFTLYGQTSIPKAQAMFIYNFSRLINWPPADRTGPFVIGVVGNSPASAEIKTFLTGKMVSSQKIVIKEFSNASQVEKCHILFVPFEQTKELEAIFAKIGSSSTLIIGEKASALDAGATIIFSVVANKLKYEIKPDNGTKVGLTISSRINEMAFKIH